MVIQLMRGGGDRVSELRNRSGIVVTRLIQQAVML